MANKDEKGKRRTAAGKSRRTTTTKPVSPRSTLAPAPEQVTTKARPVPAPAAPEPTLSCASYVNARSGSPALKRYLLRHYGSGEKTEGEWKKIVDGLRVRKVS